MTTTETFLAWLGIALTFGTIGGVVAEIRGAPAWAGGLLGLVLGPLGTFLAAVLPTNIGDSEEGTRAERLQWEAEQQRIWSESR